MRTNVDIDDAVLDAAMQAGPYKTKKDAVDAGLRLLARQAAYREILKWEGKLHWDGDDAAVSAPVRTGRGGSPQHLAAHEPRRATTGKAPRGRR